jgi:hypothetical protein
MLPWEGGGVKASGAYHLHVPIVMKSGNLSLLESSGSVQACNGITLPLPLPLPLPLFCTTVHHWTGSSVSHSGHTLPLYFKNILFSCNVIPLISK